MDNNDIQILLLSFTTISFCLAVFDVIVTHEKRRLWVYLIIFLGIGIATLIHYVEKRNDLNKAVTSVNQQNTNEAESMEKNEPHATSQENTVIKETSSDLNNETVKTSQYNFSDFTFTAHNLLMSSMPKEVSDINLNWDGSLYVIAGDNGPINVYSSISHKIVYTYTGQARVITGVAFHPVKDIIAIRSEYEGVIIWDFKANAVLAKISNVGGAGANCFLYFSKNGNRLITSSGSTVSVIDTRTWSIELKLGSKQLECVNGIRTDIDESGNLLATTGDLCNKVHVWNISTGVLVKTFFVQSRFSPEVRFGGGQIMIAYSNKIDVYNVNEFTLRVNLTLENSFDFCEWGNNIEYMPLSGVLMCGMGNEIYGVNVFKAEKKILLNSHSKKVRIIKFSMNGQWMITADYCGSQSNQITLWSISYARP